MAPRRATRPAPATQTAETPADEAAPANGAAWPDTDTAASLDPAQAEQRTADENESPTPAPEEPEPMVDMDTAVVTAQNGILWWYFHSFPGPLANHHLEAADPGGQIWRALGPDRSPARCEPTRPAGPRLGAK